MEELDTVVVLVIPHSPELAELLKVPGQVSEEVSLEIGGAGWHAKILSAGPQFLSKSKLGKNRA